MYKENYDFPAIIINHSSDDYEIRIYDICLNKEIPKATSIEEISLDYNQTLFNIKINTEEAIKKSKRLGVIVPKEL